MGVLLSAPGQSNVRFGQVSVFVVLLALTDAVGAVPPRLRGVLVGCAAAVKLTPILFIGFYLLSGRSRDAGRALVTFLGCGLLAAVLMLQASYTYWTSALFTTSRIGDLAAMGNQSVNGFLLRWGIEGPWRPVVWLVVVAALCVCALLRARALSRDGQSAHAAVLIGCATLAASPVSWTHHQFWTVLAAMLLVAGPTAARRVAGWLLLASMTLELTDLLIRLHLGDHVLFLAENARSLAVAALCVVGFGHLASSRRPAWTSSESVASSRWLRVTGARVAAGFAVLGLFAALPLPGGPDPRLRTADTAEAIRRQQVSGSLTADLIPCTGRSGPDGPCVGPALPEQMPVNYSVASTVQRVVEVEGFAGLQVGRLVYLAAPGTAPVTVPLVRLSAGLQVFAFTAGDTAYAQLKVYDERGRFLGDAGSKLRSG